MCHCENASFAVGAWVWNERDRNGTETELEWELLNKNMIITRYDTSWDLFLYSHSGVWRSFCFLLPIIISNAI